MEPELDRSFQPFRSFTTSENTVKLNQTFNQAILIYTLTILLKGDKGHKTRQRHMDLLS